MESKSFPAQSASTISEKLQMYGYQVPCFFQVTGQCESNADVVMIFEHLEAADHEPVSLPVCLDHLRVLRMSEGFWQTWLNADPMQCITCDMPVSIASVLPIGPDQ